MLPEEPDEIVRDGMERGRNRFHGRRGKCEEQEGEGEESGPGIMWWSLHNHHILDASGSQETRLAEGEDNLEAHGIPEPWKEEEG